MLRQGKLLFLITFLLYGSTVSGQIELVISPIFGINYGHFGSHQSEFSTMYQSDNSPIEFTFGIGAADIYMIGKYKTFSADGRSLLNDGVTTGIREYEENFFSLGARFYKQPTRKFRYYLELTAVHASVDESLTTAEFIPQLSGSASDQNWGFGIAVGGNFMFTDFVGIAGSVEYTRVIFEIPEITSIKEKNLGGFYTSVGIILTPFW